VTRVCIYITSYRCQRGVTRFVAMLDFYRPSSFAVAFLPRCIFMESERYFCYFSLAQTGDILATSRQAHQVWWFVLCVFFFLNSLNSMDLFLTRQVPFEITCRSTELLLFERSHNISRKLHERFSNIFARIDPTL